MCLTKEESDLVSRRAELLTQAEDSIAARVFTTLWAAEVETGNVYIAKDDRCAKFEAALVRLLIDSRKG